MQLAHAPDRVVAKILVGVVVAAVAWLLLSIPTVHAPPYLMVDRLPPLAAAYRGQQVRVHGYVSPGSRKTIAGTTTFRLVRNGVGVIEGDPMPGRCGSRYAGGNMLDTKFK